MNKRQKKKQRTKAIKELNEAIAEWQKEVEAYLEKCSNTIQLNSGGDDD